MGSPGREGNGGEGEKNISTRIRATRRMIIVYARVGSIRFDSKSIGIDILPFNTVSSFISISRYGDTDATQGTARQGSGSD